MLRSLKDMKDYQVAASDGEVGRVSDFYFEDQHWTVRYLVVDTGGFWHPTHRVLISPIAFQEADWSTRRFHVALTCDKIKNSPSVNLDKPISRQYEEAYYRYHGWAPYWSFGGSWAWGSGSSPAGLAASRWQSDRDVQLDPKADPHLRSTRMITDYGVNGGNEVLGHIKDFIIDDESWAIRYLVVNTGTWWAGKNVLMSPSWAREISWEQQTLYTDIPRATLKNSPAWTPDQPVNREYEARLYDYYGQPAYWLDTDRAREEAPSAQLPNERHPNHP